MRTQFWIPLVRLVMMSVLAANLVGCSHLRVRDRWFDSDRVSEQPSEVLPIWTDTVMHRTGKPAIRGFGGRVYFYQQGKPNPVPVDGQLVVYVFDGEKEEADSVQPLKKYVITPEQLKTHHSETSIGHSYSVWIPWDQMGGESRTLSLVARFDGVAGGTVLSKPSTKLLPGVDAGGVTTPAEQLQGEVQLAAHQQGTDLATDSLGGRASAIVSSPLKMRTESIDLPPSFQRRLLNSTWQPPAAAESAVGTGQSIDAAAAGLGPAEGQTQVQSPSRAQTQRATQSFDRSRQFGGRYDSATRGMTPERYAGESSSSQFDAREPVARESTRPNGDNSFSNGNGPGGAAEHAAGTTYPYRVGGYSAGGGVRRNPHHSGWLKGLPATPRRSSMR